MDTRRKLYWLRVLEADYRRLYNQARFVLDVMQGRVIVATENHFIIAQLSSKNYEPFPEEQGGGSGLSSDEDEYRPYEGPLGYGYLLSIPFSSLSQQYLDELYARLWLKRKQYDALNALSETAVVNRYLDQMIAERNAHAGQPRKTPTNTPESEQSEDKNGKTEKGQMNQKNKDDVPSEKMLEDSSLKSETAKATAEGAKPEADEEGWDKISDTDLDAEGANSEHLSKNADSPSELVSGDGEKRDVITEVKGGMSLQDEGQLDGLDYNDSDYDELKDEIDQSGKFIWE